MAYSHLFDSMPDSIAHYTKYSYKTRTSILNLNGCCAYFSTDPISDSCQYTICNGVKFCVCEHFGMYVSHIDRLMVPGRPSSHGWKRKPILYLPSANEVWGMLMFSQVFVCPQGEGVGFPACITSHDRGSASRGVYIQRGVGRPPQQALQDMVNKRALHILLECILVI